MSRARHSRSLTPQRLARLALATTILGAPTLAQSSSCNDTTRESDIVAGDHNMSEETCQQISFTVAGQSFSTPAKCLRGGAHYGGTIYKCAGRLEKYHCNPRGWDVDVTTYSDGGCPGLPKIDLDVLSWDSWKKVPAALAKAMECRAPKKKEDKDKSATVKPCETGNTAAEPASIQEGAVYLGGSGELYLGARGGLGGLLPSSQPQNPFLSAYDLAQTTDPGVLSGILHDVASKHPNAPGFSLIADVTITHYDQGVVTPSNVFTARVVGRITTDGRFDVTRTIPTTTPEGDPDTIVHRTTYDGTTLRDVLNGSEAGNAVNHSYPHFHRSLAAYAATVDALYTWVYDPFQLPLFEGVTFEELRGSEPGQLIAQRTFEQKSGPFVGEEWTIDISGDVPHPLSRREMDGEGFIWEHAQYSNYVAIDATHWRPSTAETTRYLGSESGDAREVVTIQIVDASLLEAAEAETVPEPFPSTQTWQVWM